MRARAILVIVAIGFMALSAIPQQREEPRLGVKSPCQASPHELIAISGSQMAPMCSLTMGAVTFTIGSDDTGKVRYIETSDPRFATPEGARVGVRNDALDPMKAKPPISEYGWATYRELPSGWCAVIGPIPAYNSPEPKGDAQVARFFKRKSGA